MKSRYSGISVFNLLLMAIRLSHSEEISCSNEETVIYKCQDGSCISRRSFCDGNNTCADGSDELTDTSLAKGGIERCQYRRIELVEKECVLPMQYRCDHEIDCYGGQDECGCDHTFECDNGDCALKVSFCDNMDRIWGCVDGTDEKEYNRTTKEGFQCPVTRTHVTKVCVLPDKYVCDGDSDCDFGIDECFCNFTDGKKKGTPLDHVYSNENCFRCLDGALVIPNIQVCDGVVHCEDLSDECACPRSRGHVRPDICNTVCKEPECGCPGQVQCQLKSNSSLDETPETVNDTICLDRNSICNDLYDCKNNIDETFCPLDKQSHPCKDGSKKIRQWQVCNGPVDCADGSDEVDCHDKFGHYCRNYRHYFPHIKDWENLSAGDVEIPSAITLPFDRPFHTKKCDGVPLCSLLDDECESGCDPEPEYCKYVTKGFRCPNSGSLIIGVEVCDGKPTCNDTAPEESLDEFGCPGRFYCRSNGTTRLPIHIAIEEKCNGKQECYDHSDELDCSEETHFYCEDGGSTLFVPISQVCDGRKDCKEGRDECQNCNPSPFSSDEKLISSRILIAVLWVIGAFAVIGNSAVFISQVIHMRKPAVNSSPITISNGILVLNLSAADLLVGVYLVGLGLKDATVSEYCLLDQEWRSSAVCAALGTIALIGTETSVFILLIMTAYRLYLVVKPFKSQKIFVIGISVAIAWLTSFVLAFVPLSYYARDYFVSCVWFKNHYFIGRICRNDLQKFTQDLVLLGGKGSIFGKAVKDGYNWNSMFAVMEHLNSSYVPERYFGYYSAHSVCLPRLFPDPENDEVWGYSLFLIMVNFCAFLFILCSYIFIYRKTTGSNLKKSSCEDRANKLQKKVTRIVMTDFCCWMPICIMAILKVAGIYIPDIAYAFTAVILLPINSAMNPFLYSDILDIVWANMRPIRIWCNQKCRKRRMTRAADRSEAVDPKIKSGKKKLKPNLSSETRSTGIHFEPRQISDSSSSRGTKTGVGDHSKDNSVFYEMKVSLTDEQYKSNVNAETIM